MRRQSVQVEMQIAPLIDVCFLLLFFFMSTAQPKFSHASLDMAVASFGTADDNFPPIEEQTIEILENGRVRWNESIMDRPENKDLELLSTSLRRLKLIADRAKTSVSIVINPADNAPYQRIIDVMIACRRSGVTDITLATDLSGGD